MLTDKTIKSLDAELGVRDKIEPSIFFEEAILGQSGPRYAWPSWLKGDEGCRSMGVALMCGDNDYYRGSCGGVQVFARES